MSKEIKANSLSEAAGTILAKLFYGAADEVGPRITEKAGTFRGENSIKIIEAAAVKYEENAITGQEHPSLRLAYKALEEGSWVENSQIQEMWSGLLVSSCSEDGKDEGNLIFISILGQLTAPQVKILNFACANAEVELSEAGLMWSPGTLEVDLESLRSIAEIDELHMLDRQLDHMRSLELIKSGFHPSHTNADVTPTALALYMYASCQGFMGPPEEFYKNRLQSDDVVTAETSEE
jgi:hypothetical protein